MIGLWLLLAAAAPSTTPGAVTASAEAAEAAREIDATVIRAHTRFLASDLTEGRAPGSRGDGIAQQYIQAELEQLGLQGGAADGGWYQAFDIVGIDGSPRKLSLKAGPRQLELGYSEEFIAVAGAQQAESRLEEAEVVFVGYGIVAPEYQWDDYKGVDLRGKVLLMMNSDPEHDPAQFAGKARLWYGRWDYKYEIAARKGAAGAIIIHTTPSAGYPWQVVQTSWYGEQFELPERGEPRLRVRAWATEAASRRIAALGGKDLDSLRRTALRRDFKPVPLGVTVSCAFKNVVQQKRTANVLAKLPGSDKELQREVVLYTAHHDHLGMKQGARPDEDAIYNGAVDNASGVAAMLAVAKAFVALPQPPRRTVLFAAVAGEEAGLLGSQHLAEHPPVPVGRFAVNINIDGVNIWGRTRDVTVIGLGKSSVDGVITALARAQGRIVKPDQMADRGFFYRSDQFNFAKVGVPAAYFGSGVEFLGRPEGWGRKVRERWEERDYHQPSDELSDHWDLSGAVEDAQLYFHLGERIAAADEMPRWNPGDEFEAARARALQAR